MLEGKTLEIHMIIIHGVWMSYSVYLIKTKGEKTASQMASLSCNQTHSFLSSYEVKW